MMTEIGPEMSHSISRNAEREETPSVQERAALLKRAIVGGPLRVMEVEDLADGVEVRGQLPRDRGPGAWAALRQLSSRQSRTPIRSQRPNKESKKGTALGKSELLRIDC